MATRDGAPRDSNSPLDSNPNPPSGNQPAVGNDEIPSDGGGIKIPGRDANPDEYPMERPPSRRRQADPADPSA